MKQYQSLKGYSTLETLWEYGFWGFQELFQAFLGCVWLGILISFFIFAYQYIHYYNMGVVKKDKSYFLTYLDMKKILKKIVTTFIMFMIGSWGASFAPGFYMTVLKGAVMGIFVLPPLYMHYNNEDEYHFSISKVD